MTRVHDLDVDVVVRVQGLLSGSGVLRGARILSRVGEHAAGWTALGLVGAALDRSRRRDWLRATGAVVAAHGVSVVLKRLVRRHRPSDPRIHVLDTTPSDWSFPSSHAASTTAAAVAYSRLLGHRWPLTVVPAMMASRVALGVHYPGDVAAGGVIGVVIGRWLAPARVDPLP
ncbi:MAG TPA: phosphatase PAP2 family protein [Cellulomonadaceae bacterium]|nr:phosphatase PAP2 family protein [Cellulomonadaceae bacterium]